MTTQAAELVRPKPATLSARIVEFLTRSPVHIVLIIVAVIWLVPSVGLLITSFRPRLGHRLVGLVGDALDPQLHRSTTTTRC